MKRCYLVLMAAVFLFLCMSGCGSREKTVLKWALFNCISDVTGYQEAVNEGLREKGIDCEIEFVNISSDYAGHYGEYVEPYWQALEEGGYDIIGMLGNWSYLEMYPAAVRRGLLLPLDPMLEERESGKKLREAYPESTWEAVKVDGAVYGAATPYLGYNCYLVFDLDRAEEYRLDLNELSEEDLEACLRLAAEGESARGNQGFTPVSYLNYRPGPDYEESGCEFIAFDVSGEIPVAKNILYEEPYLERMRTLTKWREEGLIVLDGGRAMEEGNFLADTVYSYSPEAAEYQTARRSPKTTDRLRAVAFPRMNGIYGRGTKTGIAASSAHREAAFDVLAEIYSDAGLSNALVYGTAGKDYELVDGRVVRDEKSTGEYEKMYFGNPFLTLPDSNDSPDKTQGLYEAAGTRPLSGLTGWSFDPSEVETELNRLNDCWLEHSGFSCGGSLDWEAELEELRRETERLGIDRVVEEMNAQIKEWEDR